MEEGGRVGEKRNYLREFGSGEEILDGGIGFIDIERGILIDLIEDKIV